MSELIISVSGLRGIVGETLTPEVAVRYAAAFAGSLREGPIVVTRDGRGSGRMLADAVRSSLSAMGRDVIDADIAATPTTGVLVRARSAAGGIQISASHNPAPYNGMKLFSAEGRVVDAATGEQVRDAYNAGDFAWARHDGLGSVIQSDDTAEEHLRLVLATVDVEAIRAKGFRVLLDSNHGAGSLLGGRLLNELNCDATILGDTPDGNFAHEAEPTAENLKGGCGRVREAGAAVGFCQDPDADRLAVIDENGRYIGEEYTLAICLNQVLLQTDRDGGTVVTNCATSRMSQDIASAAGFDCRISAVGEANVCDMMIAHDAVFGGEGNGGPIDPRVGYVRDSFVAMARILDAMAARDIPVSALADELPSYAIHKSKVTVARDKIPAALDQLEQHFSEAVPNRMDGLRLDWPDRWLLIRASNTEPIVRIIAEAATEAEAADLCEVTCEVIG